LPEFVVTNCCRWTLVVNTSRSFRHSWLITGFVSRVTRRVPLVLLDLYYYVQYFVDRCLSFCTFFFLAFVLCVLLWFMKCPWSFVTHMFRNQVAKSWWLWWLQFNHKPNPNPNFRVIWTCTSESILLRNEHFRVN
jgi:hypothetical protein